MLIRIKILTLLIFCLVIPAGVINAQPYTRHLNRIPVFDSEGRIPNTFSGGHNNIEHQFVDIDGDGDLDIMYLDSDGTFGWYENTGDKFNPEFVLSFDTIPGMIFRDWFYFVDIDNDGTLDLFTGRQGALIEFRRNTGSLSNPSFTLEIDTLKDNEGNYIFSELGSNPVLIDIDNDGDYDFLTGNSVGTITFYENIGNAFSFNFEFITNTWQDIIIIGGSLKPSSNPDLLFPDGTLNNQENPNLHGASSLEFADIDNDDDLDLFWGDFFSRSLYFIENKGTSTQPDMELIYSVYPPNQDSIWTSGFNMPRLVDIDNNGTMDLFVSVLFDPTVRQSLMFYRNEGTAQVPEFVKITENYLKTLDAGIQSVPAFVDIDGDGDYDLFLGSAKSPNGTLHFFENIGTPNNPSFVLTDSAYFGINSPLTIAPAFGDLDDDGDYDLLIGEFLGRISLYENIGGKFTPDFIFKEQLRDVNDNLISAGNIARPFLIDVDNNGTLDLVVGGFNGRITLYRNIGTQQEYIFERDSAYFGNISVGNYSSPFMIDYDNNGILDLFIGGSGNIFYYRNDGTNNNPVWTLVTNKFLNQNFGTDAAPFFIDIDDDTDLDLFVGNYKGGLYYFENDLVTGIEFEDLPPSEFIIADAYPNPFNSSIKIQVNMPYSDEVTISVFNTLGQKVTQLYKGLLYPGKNIYNWNGKNDKNEYLSSGNYFVVIKSSQQQKSLKITYLK